MTRACRVTVNSLALPYGCDCLNALSETRLVQLFKILTTYAKGRFPIQGILNKVNSLSLSRLLLSQIWYLHPKLQVGDCPSCCIPCSALLCKPSEIFRWCPTVDLSWLSIMALSRCAIVPVGWSLKYLYFRSPRMSPALEHQQRATDENCTKG